MLFTANRILLFSLLTLTTNIESARAALVSGPMVNCVDMREARIWIQADAPSEIVIQYSESESGTSYQSHPVQTDPELGSTATICLDQVEPGNRYDYYVLQNGEKVSPLYQFKTPENYDQKKPPPDFTFAVGGAHYVMQEGYEPPYKLLGGGYDIFQVIHKSSPDFMIWAGNTAHLRSSDFNTSSGILKRFSHARSIPQMAPLLGSTPHYAIWSKSDYSYEETGKYYSYRELTKAAFTAFWPQPVKLPKLDGIATRFRYADADFFMLDIRSNRDIRPNSSNHPKILDRPQIEWLVQELKRSEATFKIIVSGSPALNPANNPSNLSYADMEQTALLEMLRRENISGLFFISGGKYFGEMTKLVHASNYNLFELTVGPLTAKPKNKPDELNYFRVPGTLTTERQFALISISGTEEERRLSISIKNMTGDELWSQTLHALHLQSDKDLK